jgi:hypothetical protein
VHRVRFHPIYESNFPSHTALTLRPNRRGNEGVP